MPREVNNADLIGSSAHVEAGRSVSATGAVEAATRALYTAGHVQVQYDSTVSAPLISPGFIPGGVTPVTMESVDAQRYSHNWDDTAYSLSAIDAGDTAGRIVKRSSLSGLAASRAGDEEKIRRLLNNAVFFRYDVGEHLYLCDPELYKEGAAIDPNHYISGGEAILDYKVERLCRASIRVGSAWMRRLALLVTRLKDAILAQNNDTNPFYAMPKAEMFDRLALYFSYVSRAVVSTLNVGLAVGLKGSLLLGARVYYTDIYSKKFTADAVSHLQEVNSLLRATLATQFFEPYHLRSFMEMGVISLLPNQDGCVRVALPRGKFQSKDGVGLYTFLGSDLLQPESARSIENIVWDLNQFTQFFHSGDASVVRSALLPYDVLSMVGPIDDVQIGVSPRLINAWRRNSKLIVNPVYPAYIGSSYIQGDTTYTGQLGWLVRYNGGSVGPSVAPQARMEMTGVAYGGVVQLDGSGEYMIAGLDDSTESLKPKVYYRNAYCPQGVAGDILADAATSGGIATSSGLLAGTGVTWPSTIPAVEESTGELTSKVWRCQSWLLRAAGIRVELPLAARVVAGGAIISPDIATQKAGMTAISVLEHISLDEVHSDVEGEAVEQYGQPYVPLNCLSDIDGVLVPMAIDHIEIGHNSPYGECTVAGLTAAYGPTIVLPALMKVVSATGTVIIGHAVNQTVVLDVGDILAAEGISGPASTNVKATYITFVEARALAGATGFVAEQGVAANMAEAAYARTLARKE